MKIHQRAFLELCMGCMREVVLWEKDLGSDLVLEFYENHCQKIFFLPSVPLSLSHSSPNPVAKPEE